MISRDNIILKLKELKPFLQQEYSVREIGLFGSFSEETQSEHSDIDF